MSSHGLESMCPPSLRQSEPNVMIRVSNVSTILPSKRDISLIYFVDGCSIKSEIDFL